MLSPQFRPHCPIITIFVLNASSRFVPALGRSSRFKLFNGLVEENHGDALDEIINVGRGFQSLSSALVFVPLHVALESCCGFSPVGSDVLSGVSYFLPFSLSAVDQSGSAGSGQPLVNAVRTDSALIGGTEPVSPFSSSS